MQQTHGHGSRNRCALRVALTDSVQCVDPGAGTTGEIGSLAPSKRPARRSRRAREARESRFKGRKRLGPAVRANAMSRDGATCARRSAAAMAGGVRIVRAPADPVGVLHGLEKTARANERQSRATQEMAGQGIDSERDCRRRIVRGRVAPQLAKMRRYGTAIARSDPGHRRVYGPEARGAREARRKASSSGRAWGTFIRHTRAGRTAGSRGGGVPTTGHGVRRGEHSGAE